MLFRSTLAFVVLIAGRTAHASSFAKNLYNRYERYRGRLNPDDPSARHKRRADLIDSTIAAWKDPQNVQNVGLRSFATSYAPLVESDACNGAGLEELIDYKIDLGVMEPVTDRLWVCRHEFPARAVCKPTETFGRDFIPEYFVKGIHVSVVLSDFASTGILGIVQQCDAPSRLVAIKSILDLFTTIKRTYYLPNFAFTEAVTKIDELAQFCRLHSDSLKSFSGDRGEAAKLSCPGEPFGIEYQRSSVIAEWKASVNAGGLRSFAAHLQDSVACRTIDAGSRSAQFLFEHFWLCGTPSPPAVVCSQMEKVVTDLFNHYMHQQASLSEFLADFAAAGILESAIQCAPNDIRIAIEWIINLFATIRRSKELSTTELRAALVPLSQLSRFCRVNSRTLSVYAKGPRDDVVPILCPAEPFGIDVQRSRMLNSGISAWKSSSTRSGLRSFYSASNTLLNSGACEREGLKLYLDKRIALGNYESLFDQLWMCGMQMPTSVACRPEHQQGRLKLAEYQNKGVELSEFLADFGVTEILAMVGSCNPNAQKNAVYSLLRLFSETQHMYRQSDSELKTAVSSLEQLQYFCQVNRDLLENREGENEDVIHILCPKISRSLSSLKGIIQRLPRPDRSNLLRVRRDHAFTDAVPLLTDKFVEVGVLAGILLDDETVAAPMSEWLLLAGREAASLLFTEEGKEFKPDVPENVLYAFGRLMAYAIRHRSSLGMKFPENFFRDLLKRREEDDYSPIRPIDRIREGLEYFYAVPRILEVINVDEFKLLFITMLH